MYLVYLPLIVYIVSPLKYYNKYLFYEIITNIFSYVNVFTFISIISLVIIFTGILVYIYSMRNVLIITLYIYYLGKYIIFSVYSDNSFITVMMIIISSIFTLTILLSNERTKFTMENLIKGIFMYLKHISSHNIAIIMTSILLLRIVRDLIKCYLLGYISDLPVEIFIHFSCILYIIILFRIINSTIETIYYLGVTDCSLILIVLINSASSHNNYKLSNISISSMVIFVLLFVAVLEVNSDSILLHNYPKSNNLLHNIQHKYYIISPYEQFSLPNGMFRDEIPLNKKLGVSLLTLQNNDSLSVPRPTGHNTDNTYRLLCSLDGKRRIAWVRHNSGLYFKEYYLKGAFTRNIGKFTAEPIFAHDYSLLANNFFFNKAVLDSFEAIQNFPTDESRVDGLVSSICNFFFGPREGYVPTPQYRFFNEETNSEVKADLVMSYSHVPILVVENKSMSKSSSSILDLIQQARDYASLNEHYNVGFVMVVKSTKASFFFYQQDWHSDNSFDLKAPEYEDMLGLEVTNEGVSIIPQCNTFYPQLKLYDLHAKSSRTHILSITAILSYITKFKTVSELNSDYNNNDLKLPSNNHELIHLANGGVGLNIRLYIDPFAKFRLHN